MSAERYVEYVLFNYLLSSEFDKYAADQWLLEAELEFRFCEAARKAFVKHGYDVGNRYDALASSLFKDFLEKGVIQREGDRYTGMFTGFSIPPKDNVVKALIGRNEITSRIARLGTDALERALSLVAHEEGWRLRESGEKAPAVVSDLDRATFVPASDRIVTLSHNQGEGLAEQIDDLADNLSGFNQFDGDPELRTMLIGQLRAGRELVRSGCFRLYLLEVTLVNGLRYLVSCYEHEAIGAMASVLLTALAKHIGMEV